LTDLEFVYGQFKTYQVPIAQIEKKSGLNFGKLKDFDPLSEIEGRPFKLIETLRQIAL
jgi:endonuclease G, mitochondrial